MYWTDLDISYIMSRGVDTSLPGISWLEVKSLFRAMMFCKPSLHMADVHPNLNDGHSHMHPTL